MRFTLLMHYPEATTADIDEAAIHEGMVAFKVYAEALEAAGVLVSAEVLQPASAAITVRLLDGVPSVQDGTFASTKEQLGGTFVINVPDLDAALAWAEKCPAVHWGVLEIRPTAVRFVKGVWQNEA